MPQRNAGVQPGEPEARPHPQDGHRAEQEAQEHPPEAEEPDQGGLDRDGDDRPQQQAHGRRVEALGGLDEEVVAIGQGAQRRGEAEDHESPLHLGRPATADRDGHEREPDARDRHREHRERAGGVRHLGGLAVLAAAAVRGHLPCRAAVESAERGEAEEGHEGAHQRPVAAALGAEQPLLHDARAEDQELRAVQPEREQRRVRGGAARAHLARGREPAVGRAGQGL
jgi:hypothetical protein